ncbi:cobyric acid synthase [Peribacillus cavernae]|uniref:Cobyric acid synthase n=1 Tax=Peribacillus cavernae TaxID=1674310 RepID=A0A3S0W320_9BACI|nr:cobyric acid synthase [Peribacillus cavernae]MDQ0218591.1 adenosylcobyric acid synthase [Peribacillus cavernae]RUQ31578.1 cobyric acid synthase [Peribacillus cavernae]
MKGIMIQGTSSDAGKSFITTVFCRLLANEGIKVAPFKSQNMSNNSYVTVDGSEIGRAQGIQAEAANTEASVWMNPILLKPKSDQSSEIVLFGKPLRTLSGMSYREDFYEQGIDVIKQSLARLEEAYDAVIMEGAGSPVEINLKDRELVNMKVAELADVPVILVADIERGGIFASIVGTLELLTPSERKRVKGIIVNKFRGDIRLFEDGVAWIEERTEIPVLGVIPYINGHMVEGEDSLSLADRFSDTKKSSIELAVLKLPYISNYTDIEPFLYEEDVSIRWVEEASAFGKPDALIIPGTKSTIHDLRYLKKTGLAQKVIDYYHHDGTIIGICGGFQMLCEELIDAEGMDTGSRQTKEEGLSLIPAKTFFSAEKKTIRTMGSLHSETNLPGNVLLEGYEIHLGHSVWNTEHGQSPFLVLDKEEEEGFYEEKGRLIGTYLHHLFHNDEWRALWLNMLRQKKQLPPGKTTFMINEKFKKLDEAVEQIHPFLKWDKVKEIIDGWGQET